jgi:hypothetical protein
MLFVHEIHRVMGLHEDDFEREYREGWMPSLAQDDDARLLYFARHAHGTGRAYNMITITAVRDGAAWQRLTDRLRTGDLRSWAAHVDTMRHDVTSKVLMPVDWSPLQDVDLQNVPTAGDEHDATLFMEDTAWPHAGRMEDYLSAARDNSAPSLAEGRHGGALAARARSGAHPRLGNERPPPRGDPLAADHQAGRHPRAPHPRGPGRAPRTRHLDARRARGP